MLADDASTAVITETVEALIIAGADIGYEVIPPEAQGFVREAIKPNTAD